MKNKVWIGQRNGIRSSVTVTAKQKVACQQCTVTNSNIPRSVPGLTDVTSVKGFFGTYMGLASN